VHRDDLAQLGRELGAPIAVANAFHGPIVEQGLVISELSDDELRHIWGAYRYGRRDIDPMLPRMVSNANEVITLRRADVVDNRTWYRSRLVRDYFDPLRLDHCIQSEVWLTGNVWHHIALVRQWGDRPFSEHERDRVHSFHRALLRQHHQRRPSLAPRTSAVLRALLEGRSAKIISDGLGLSRSSLYREIQTIYRLFRVHTRSELLAIAPADADRGPKWPELLERLSLRQVQIYALLRTELSEAEIGCVLGISHNTVNSYVKSMYRALGVGSRPELVALSRQRLGSALRGVFAQTTSQGERRT
jgi:DNA-binding CsgD family transcriptional regulator